MIDFSAVAAVFSAYVVGVALFLSHEAVSGAYRRAQEWIDRACGAVIVALGVRQALR
jgi:threonine/homoserine/homoserine lactone efflux protein